MKESAIGAVFVSLILVLASSGCGGSARVRGVRARSLDAGSIIGADFPLKGGRSFTLGLVFIKNVGSQPILFKQFARIAPRPTSELPADTSGSFLGTPI